MQAATIKGISSMATRQLLAELAALFERRSGCGVAFESVGGVEAVRRLMAGESFDLAVLASDAIDKLIAAGRIVAGSRRDLARSGVALAVRAGAARPEIGSEEALRRAVLAARSIGYSTGPSGVALAALFERWGIAEEIRGRILTPPPGVPVGSLLASGEVELGFQQLSELIRIEGIALLGPLPPAVQINTIFSAGICAGSGGGPAQAEAVQALLAFMAAPELDELKRRQGMEPV